MPTRIPNGTPVPFSEALTAWTSAAFALLVGVACEPSKITYGELQRRMVLAAGIDTPMSTLNLMPRVLGRVARECVRRGLPPLTSLVINKALGDVGDGYALVLELEGEDAPSGARLVEHAAEARLACYRYFGPDVSAQVA